MDATAQDVQAIKAAQEKSQEKSQKLIQTEMVETHKALVKESLTIWQPECQPAFRSTIWFNQA